MLALLIFRTLFVSDVSAKMEAPSQVKQGDEFTVTITINKGSISGVGHIKQELPAGFGNATVVDVKGGEFRFLPEDNVIKITWLSLPVEEEFTISYKIMVSPSMANGRVNMDGKFSYILANQKQTTLMPNSSILIGTETTNVAIASSDSTTITTQNKLDSVIKTVLIDTTQSAKSAEQKSENTPVISSNPVQQLSPQSVVIASRSILGTPEAGMEFTVEVNVKKEGIKGFARIQELLPMGFTAKALESKGGTFSFIDQKVKISWDNLSDGEDIKVSYRVLVPENAAASQSISGAFSYVDKDDPKKVEIPSTEISIKVKESIVASSNQIGNTTVSTNQTANTTTIAESTSNTPPIVESKINYRIQICALSKTERDAKFFEVKYSNIGKVNIEFHEGWKKYLIGKYAQYQEARTQRESIKSKGVVSPFVTAYNNGKRITVQEALLVSNQKWIQ